jgi:hypothetical protein
MIQKRSVVLGLLFGAIVLAAGVALIFAKDWVWALFELLYGMLGIQSERTRMWELFITTIGLFVSASGLFVLWSVWRIRRSSQS